MKRHIPHVVTGLLKTESKTIPEFEKELERQARQAADYMAFAEGDPQARSDYFDHQAEQALKANQRAHNAVGPDRKMRNS